MEEASDLKVVRMHRFDGEGKTKAFVDIAVSGVVIKGLKVVDGAKGLFVSMPRHQGKDGKWYDTVYPGSNELKQQLSNLVLAAYEE